MIQSILYFSQTLKVRKFVCKDIKIYLFRNSYAMHGSFFKKNFNTFLIP